MRDAAAEPGSAQPARYHEGVSANDQTVEVVGGGLDGRYEVVRTDGRGGVELREVSGPTADELHERRGTKRVRSARQARELLGDLPRDGDAGASDGGAQSEGPDLLPDPLIQLLAEEPAAEGARLSTVTTLDADLYGT